MKKIVNLYLMFLICVFALLLVGCSKNKGEISVMLVDINPSIEFILDEEGKVASVTALNDDGSILISGEVFVGMKENEALNKYLEIALECGYLTSSDDYKAKIAISISGDSKYAKELRNEVKNQTEEFIEKAKCEINFEEVKEYTYELIKEQLDKCKVETDKLSNDELLEKLKEERIATEDLITNELRNAYYQVKDYEINLKLSEKQSEYIKNSQNIAVKALATGYDQALNAYNEAIKSIDEAIYQAFVSEEGPYQKALIVLRDAKVNVVNARSNLTKFEEGSEEYTRYNNTLDELEKAFNDAEKALNTAKEASEQAIEGAKLVLNSAKQVLDMAYQSIYSLISTDLDAKADELNEYLNAYKDNFFKEFETQHKDDIASINAKIKEAKDSLKNKDNE